MTQWFRTLPTELYQWALLVALPAVLTGMLVRAFWVGRAPGEVSRAERAGIFLRLRRRLLNSRVVFQFVIPALILGGFVLVFLPVEAPVTVLLPSRARSPNQDMMDWQQRWGDLIRATLVTSGGTSLIDAGPVVDDVLAALAADGRQFRADDSGTLQTIRNAIEQRLAKGTAPAVAAGTDVLHPLAPAGLPAWVVETVEVSVILRLEASNNVRGVTYLFADRQVHTGSSWETIAPLLMGGAPLRKDVIVAPQDVRLVRAYGLTRPAPGTPDLPRLDALFELARPASPPTGPPPTVRVVLLRGTDKHESLPVGFDPSQDGLARATASFPALPPTFAPDQAYLKIGDRLGDPVKLDELTRLEHWSGDVVVRAGPDSARWVETWTLLNDGASRLTLVRDWRNSFAALPGASRITFKMAGAAVAADAVAIDCESFPSAVVVRPDSVAVDQLRRQVEPAAADVPLPWFISPRAGASAGPFSLAGWSLFDRPTLKPRGVASRVVVDRWPPVSALSDGLHARSDEAARPLVWRAEVQVTETTGLSGWRVATYFGLNPTENQMLPDAAALARGDTERGRAAAFWMELARSIVLAADRPEVHDATRSRDFAFSVWTEAELARARGQAIRAQLTPVLLSLFLYALYVLNAVRTAPAKDKGAIA